MSISILLCHFCRSFPAVLYLPGRCWTFLLAAPLCLHYTFKYNKPTSSIIRLTDLLVKMLQEVQTSSSADFSFFERITRLFINADAIPPYSELMMTIIYRFSWLVKPFCPHHIFKIVHTGCDRSTLSIVTQNIQQMHRAYLPSNTTTCDQMSIFFQPNHRK